MEVSLTRGRDKADQAEALSLLCRFLKNKGLRSTPAREAILKAALDQPGHFDADQLYLTLRQEGPGVSKASVYRTLPLLLEAELVRQIYSEDGHLLYEPAFGRAHHCHLRCLNCRRIIEFQSEKLTELEDWLARKYGFDVQGHQIEVYGLCPDCRAKAGQD
ncbi:MAG: transcriptional repressor [Deltaproteobacteria bacterium]|nr:transcriptional repressor [Deltaproteobacteria bacterium]